MCFYWLAHTWFCSADVDLSLPDVQLSPGHSADPSPSPEAPGPSTSSASRHHRTHRSGGARDDRYRSGTQHMYCVYKKQTLKLWDTLIEYPPAILFIYISYIISLSAYLFNTFLFFSVHFTCLSRSVYSYHLCRHPHRGCAGSTGQTQRREDGTAHADQETLSLCPVSHRYLHTSR